MTNRKNKGRNTRTAPPPAQIKAARRAAGLSQTEAGERVGVALRTWQQWEAGDRRIPMSAWELFAIKTSGGGV